MKLIAENWKDSFKWDFGAYPFFTSVYLKNGLLKTKNKYYVSWNDFIGCFDNGHLLAYKPKKGLLKIGEKVIEESFRGKNDFLKEIDKIQNKINEEIIFCLDKKNTNDFKNFDKWWPKIQKAYSNASIMFDFDYTFDIFLNELKIKSPKDYKILNEFIINDKLSFIDEADKFLLELDNKNQSKFDKIYKDFIKKFSWFQNSYRGIYKIDKKWLNNYLKKIKNEVSKNNTRVNEIDEELPEKYKIIIQIANKITILRDDRKKLLLIAADLMERWLKYICKKNSWKFNEMRWLTVDEILEILQKNNNNLLYKAKQYYKNKKRIGLMTYSGYDDVGIEFWHKILKFYEVKKDISEIHGVTASKGWCKGIAKIILDPRKESYKFEKGDILVTSMTRPEFLFLAKNAKALVTDEGGISCHAAIVAREMKIPCIIGTKIATKILKDGDLVEVDANKGVVKIIKKAN